MPYDFYVNNQGTIYLLQPLTEEAQHWVDDNVHAESYQHFGDAIAVEHRYISPILDALEAAGYSVHMQ